jgi:predicted TIM-barrel fold metal-dependent hydrolase
MIDVHIHVVPPQLPGAGPLSPVLEGPVDGVAEWLRREMESAGIKGALAMGSCGAAEEDPLGVSRTLGVAALVPGLSAIGIADPRRTDSDHLRRVDTVLATRRVRALKAYLGYLHYPPDHAAYRPYYELAERHGLPFIFHTGDTYSARAKLRYAHPLLVDDVAVDHPKVNFVLAHLGNPWLTDAAEVVYKNLNVWADLSGLVVGDEASFNTSDRREALQEVRDAVRKAFRYAERPNRFLYGSDWPLAPMAVYQRFIGSAIPEVHHTLVFRDNATALFRTQPV